MSRLPALSAGLIGFALFVVLGEKWWGVAWACVAIFVAFKVGPSTTHATAEPRLFSAEQRRELAGLACTYCGRQVHYGTACPFGGCRDDYEADHVDAFSAGGETSLANGVVSCRRCNREKGARPVDEFLEDPDGDGVPGL